MTEKAKIILAGASAALQARIAEELADTGVEIEYREEGLQLPGTFRDGFAGCLLEAELTPDLDPNNDPVHKGMAKFKFENAHRSKFRK